MEYRNILAVVAVIVGLSLVAAPLTMADWGEDAHLHVERVDESAVGEDEEVIQYETLSPDGRTAISRAIASPDGEVTIYGREDWPDRFRFGDAVGYYVVVKDGQHYRVMTSGAGSLGLLWVLPTLPFVAYGGLLAGVGWRTYDGGASTVVPALATGLGVAVHLLGPEFDFPLLSPKLLIYLGLGGLVALAGWLWTTPGRD